MEKDTIPHLSPGQFTDIEEQLIEREPMDIQSFKRIIREMGLKVTGQRLAILQSLSSGRTHVTAQEVFEDIGKKHPEMGFATVYRFLRKLTESGFASEVRMGGLPARYELKSKTHHDHLTCTRCGKIVEFENQKIERLQLEVARHFGFHLTDHVLELYGVCGDCR